MSLLASYGRQNKIVKVARPAASGVTKGSAAAQTSTKGTLRKPVRNRRPSLLEQVKSPMTLSEARKLTQALHAPSRPTRKLPPRP
ncbi:hypothetical protein AB0D60_35130 [Streptomyces sp. NPDC048306]|uniref:hypothetical protein n=1 Tax=Streptomyces sp. NPDC048306 TaxID=3154502 RepID=UPI00340F6DA6